MQREISVTIEKATASYSEISNTYPQNGTEVFEIASKSTNSNITNIYKG
jgi:hypothetical protein